MKIEFVSYTGKYPCYCTGVATFLIDGKEYKFGHEAGSYIFTKNRYNDDNLDEFWSSGGSCGINPDGEEILEYGPWKLNSYWEKSDEKHPQWIIDILPELLNSFNENVPEGCCGGCI